MRLQSYTKCVVCVRVVVCAMHASWSICKRPYMCANRYVHVETADDASNINEMPHLVINTKTIEKTVEQVETSWNNGIATTSQRVDLAVFYIKCRHTLHIVQQQCAVFCIERILVLYWAHSYSVLSAFLQQCAGSTRAGRDTNIHDRIQTSLKSSGPPVHFASNQSTSPQYTSIPSNIRQHMATHGNTRQYGNTHQHPTQRTPRHSHPD